MTPAERRLRRFLMILGCLPILGVLYLVSPVVAGMFGIGERWGPRIYPVGLHSGLYSVGWEMVSWHDAIKPRLPIGARPEDRPWFYGMYSRNSDPAVMEERRREFQERLSEDIERHAGS